MRPLPWRTRDILERYQGIAPEKRPEPRLGGTLVFAAGPGGRTVCQRVKSCRAQGWHEPGCFAEDPLVNAVAIRYEKSIPDVVVADPEDDRRAAPGKTCRLRDRKQEIGLEGEVGARRSVPRRGKKNTSAVCRRRHFTVQSAARPARRASQLTGAGGSAAATAIGASKRPFRISSRRRRTSARHSTLAGPRR